MGFLRERERERVGGGGQNKPKEQDVGRRSCGRSIVVIWSGTQFKVTNTYRVTVQLVRKGIPFWFSSF